MKKRKILSLFLSLCLLIGLLPTVALAADQVAAESGVRITEAAYDSTNNILTINVEIKMPNNSGIKTVGSIISYDSSKLTLIDGDGDIYTPASPAIDADPAIQVKLIDKAKQAYNTDSGVKLYGDASRAGLFVGLGSTKGPSDKQKTTDWLTIYQLRFKVSGNAADVLNSDSLRIADPAVDNDVIKGAYPANNKFVISVDSGDSTGYKYGKMKDYAGGEVGGNNYVMNSANVTATYPGSTNSPSPATKTLDSIAVTAAPTKTTYTAGENFDPNGMVVTATYNDGSTAAVTTYTVTDGNSLTAGKTSITISYTEGGVAKTCTQAITVNAHWTYTGGGVTTYSITVKSAKNGDVTASHKSASKGTTVTLTVDPDKGYVLDTLTVLDGKDKEIKLTEKNGKYTFTMPASKVTVEAMFEAEQSTGKNPFTDVPAGSYYEDAVIWAVDKGITTGTGNGRFSPDAPCTRAQIVTFLWRAAGSPAPKSMSSFSDVPAEAFYAKAVAWAVEKGITSGTGDGKFSPDATCTRAQAVTFLCRANGSPAVSGNSAFTDVAADAYYAAAVKWAEKNGITGGIGGGLFGSNNNCTRAQIVTFLYRSVK